MVSKNFKTNAGLIALCLIALTLYARAQIYQHEHFTSYEEWRFDRDRELRSEHTSWLNLAGLFWLEEGFSTFGYDRGNLFRLSEGEGPAQLGQFYRTQDSVFFEPHPEVLVTLDGKELNTRVQLAIDSGEDMNSSILSHGALKWWVIARDGLIGVRVRDTNNKSWKEYSGIETFEFNKDWRLSAQFVPYDQPQEFTYPTVIGTMRTEESPGLLIFQYKGNQYEMIPFLRNEGKRLFLVFGDQTNAELTYGGGRFLYVEKGDDLDDMTIDFNRAYNPPCAFSIYSTCPQPLPQNRLPFSVEAGEKKYDVKGK